MLFISLSGPFCRRGGFNRSLSGHYVLSHWLIASKFLLWLIRLAWAPHVRTWQLQISTNQQATSAAMARSRLVCDTPSAEKAMTLSQFAFRMQISLPTLGWVTGWWRREWSSHWGYKWRVNGKAHSAGTVFTLAWQQHPRAHWHQYRT